MKVLLVAGARHTLREDTERPVTIEMGTNVLAGTTRSSILEAFRISRRKQGEAWKRPPALGRASGREDLGDTPEVKRRSFELRR